jgi:ATP-binding cassette subfamily C (CFTR/MRP) protein 4
MKTYKKYFKYVESWSSLIGVIFLYIVSEVLYTGFYYLFGTYDTEEERNQLFIILAVLLALFIIICITKYLMTVFLLGISNRNMHKQMFHSISKAPSLYFDQTPSGRILNKFSNDLGSADLMLPFMFFDCIECPLQLINISITVGVLNPWLFIVTIVTLISTMYYLRIVNPLIV